MICTQTAFNMNSNNCYFIKAVKPKARHVLLHILEKDISSVHWSFNIIYSAIKNIKTGTGAYATSHLKILSGATLHRGN